MKITQYYPVLQVADVAATAAFYQEHFDFEAQFDSDPGWPVLGRDRR